MATAEQLTKETLNVMKPVVILELSIDEAEYLMFFLRNAQTKWRRDNDFHSQTRDEEIRYAIHQALDIAGVS